MKTHTDLFGNPYLVSIQALTWKPPFGILMLPEWGKIETRSWHTLYRGPVLICLSQQGYKPEELAEICHPEQLELILKVSTRFIDFKKFWLAFVCKFKNLMPTISGCVQIWLLSFPGLLS